MFKWIEIKDLLYWLIIVIMASLLSSDIGQHDRLVLDNWTFAGTVVSIILAVIAILYTFDQSSTTVASTKKLVESAKRVEEATIDLENNNLNVIIEDLEDRLSNLLKKMNQDLRKNLNKNFKLLKNWNKSDYSIDKETLILNKEEWEKYLHNVIVVNLEPVGLTLLYSYFLYENDLKYIDRDTKEWLRNFVVNYDIVKDAPLKYDVVKDASVEEATFNMTWGTIIGQMRLFASLNVFTYYVSGKVDDTEDGNFIYYDDVVYNLIKNIIETNGDKINFILDDLKLAFKHK